MGQWKEGFLNATSKIITITFDACTGLADGNEENITKSRKILSHLKDLEDLLEDIKKRLSSQHFLVIKMIMQLSLFTSKVALMLGNDTSGKEVSEDKDDDQHKLLRIQFNRHQALCRSVIRYLSTIDPGCTPTLGQFMLEANKSKMALDKMDLDEGEISRIQFLSRLKKGVQIETSARQMVRAKQ